MNDRGITNKGYRWHKGGLHYLLTNEVYTGTAVWGKTTKGEQSPDPVRVENAWPALVSRELFDSVQQALHERAPAMQRPARVGSKFLLSGLLRCGHCGRPYTGQGAKSGQFAYYVWAPCTGRAQASAKPVTSTHPGRRGSWWRRSRSVSSPMRPSPSL